MWHKVKSEGSGTKEWHAGASKNGHFYYVRLRKYHPSSHKGYGKMHWSLTVREHVPAYYGTLIIKQSITAELNPTEAREEADRFLTLNGYSLVNELPV